LNFKYSICTNGSASQADTKKAGGWKSRRLFFISFDLLQASRLNRLRLGHGDWVRPMNIATAAAVISNSRTAQKHVKLLA
jgi:hypothetical protein